MFYESLLLLGVLSVSYMVPHIALGMIWGITLPGPVQLLHVFLVLAAYFLWYWSHGGQTLAMQTWGLVLVDGDRQAPSRKQLLLRYLLSWYSLVFFGAGIFWALFDRERQFLHDRLAGTRIIFAPPTTTSKPPPAGT